MLAVSAVKDAYDDIVLSGQRPFTYLISAKTHFLPLQLSLKQYEFAQFLSICGHGHIYNAKLSTYSAIWGIFEKVAKSLIKFDKTE